MEDSINEADYIIYGEEWKEEYKNLSNISQLKKDFPDEIKNCKFGDLISFSEYRDSKTFIVGKDGELIENPQYNGSGYLSIPLEITKYLSSAVEKYRAVEPCELCLRHDDDFIKEAIGDMNPEWNFEYEYFYSDSILSVTFPNKVNKQFNIGQIVITPEYIFNCYFNSNKEQDRFMLKFTFKDNDYDRFIDIYGDLYKTPDVHHLFWEYEHGSSGGGRKERHGIHKYKGPSEYGDTVINIIKNFYNGFDYEIVYKY
tara:strand:- start:596 stop:1363 length:768 start_codon:yes stop_codon:yes gene_type:complete